MSSQIVKEVHCAPGILQRPMANESTIEQITFVEDLIAHKLVDLLIEITNNLANHQITALKSALDQFYCSLEKINLKLGQVIGQELPPSGIPRFDKQLLLRQLESLQSIQDNKLQQL